MTIRPAGNLAGSVRLPGDKSISHRYAMLAAIADGETRIHHYSTGADCHSTLGCVRALGVERLAPTMSSLFAEASKQGAMKVTDAEVMARLVLEWIARHCPAE